MPCLSPYHWPEENSAKFRKKAEIPCKWANSAAQLRILHSVENCDPWLWLCVYESSVLFLGSKCSFMSLSSGLVRQTLHVKCWTFDINVSTFNTHENKQTHVIKVWAVITTKKLSVDLVAL